jgi:beta-phosphoglucomutase-like phosphatase (HAD superfamily)
VGDGEKPAVLIQCRFVPKETEPPNEDQRLELRIAELREEARLIDHLIECLERLKRLRATEPEARGPGAHRAGHRRSRD